MTQADIDAGSFTNSATANATDPGGNPVAAVSDDPTDAANIDPDGDGNPSDPTVTDLGANGSLAVTKTASINDGGDGVVNVGDTINYSFSVTNTGNVTLTNITLNDPNATVSGGPIASLAVGGVDNSTFTASYTITQADLNAGSFTNSATATGTDPDGNPVNGVSDDPANTTNADPDGDGNPSDPTVTTLPSAGSMLVTKTGTLNDGGDGTADVGDTITYAFTVSNTGNVTLTNITLSDADATVSGGPIASLAVGASDNTTFTASHTLTQADIDSGSFTNSATATGSDPGGNPVVAVSDDPVNAANVDPDGDGNPSDPTVTNLGASASIAVTKAGTLNDGGDGVANIGDTITYAFTVTNTGNVTLSNITLSDADATISGGPIASLAPGAVNSTTFTGSHTLTQADIDAGSFTNTAIATGRDPGGNPVSGVSDDPADTANIDPDGDGNPSDPTVIDLGANGSLAITKTATLNDGGDGIANVGDTISYAFAITNTGNVTLTNISVTDPNVTVSGGPITSLAPGATVSSTITAGYTLTQADIDAGSFSNSATATGTDPNGDPVTGVSDDPADPTNSDPDGDGNPSDPTVTDLGAVGSLALTKVATVNDGGDGVANLGDTITYAFTVTNTGNVTLTNVTLSDPGVTVSGGPIASLAVGASDSTTFTASHTFVQADLDAGSFTNSATITGTDPDGNPVTGVSDDPADSTNADPDGDGNPSDPTVTTYTVNQPPAAVNDLAETDAGVPVNIDVAANDNDPENLGLTVTTITQPTNGTATILPDGTIEYVPNTGFDGADSFTYTICDNFGECDTAQVDVTVNVGFANLNGIVYVDLNNDDIHQSSEPLEDGWIVEVVNQQGQTVATTTTDTNGYFEFLSIPVAQYDILFRNPENNTVYGRIDDLQLIGGTTSVDQNLPIDPSGVVYDSDTRQPIEDVLMTLVDGNGDPLPGECLLDPSQQNQMTDSDGRYRFDIIPGASPQCGIGESLYQIVFDAPGSYNDVPSTNILGQPMPLNPPAGTGAFAIVPFATAPAVGDDTTYYLGFVLASGDRDVINNHIPIDDGFPPLQPLAVSKTSPYRDVSFGDLVPYEITITNLDAITRDNLITVDLMPRGFEYVPNSARINGMEVVPTVNGQQLIFGDRTLGPNESITVNLIAVVGAGAPEGNAVNRALVRSSLNGVLLSSVGEATVRVQPTPVFDCAEVLGRVFDDYNRDGYQDDGEPGIPDAKIVSVDGLIINTDDKGRYHIACAKIPNSQIGSNFILKLDERSLPTGYRITSENPRVQRLTRGKSSHLNFGAAMQRVVTLDLAPEAFAPGTVQLNYDMAQNIQQLIGVLREQEALLRINYHVYTAEPKGLSDARLDRVAKHIDELWASQRCCYKLVIETNMLTPQAVPARAPYRSGQGRR